MVVMSTTSYCSRPFSATVTAFARNVVDAPSLPGRAWKASSRVILEDTDRLDIASIMAGFLTLIIGLTVEELIFQSVKR